jgi:hypothetical protein
VLKFLSYFVANLDGYFCSNFGAFFDADFGAFLCVFVHSSLRRLKNFNHILPFLSKVFGDSYRD